MNLISYNYAELLERKRKWEEYETGLKIEIKSVRENLNFITQVMSEHNKEGKKWIIQIDDDKLKRLNYYALLGKTFNEQKKPVKWKKLVLGIFNSFKIPMTTDLVYHKLRQTVDINKDRRFVIKNISAAINSLITDGTLFKIKLDGKENLYAFPYCFDQVGNLKKDYLIKFKIENGEK